MREQSRPFGQSAARAARTSGARLRRYAPVVLLAIATAAIARASILRIYEKLGHPGAALDDAYIHFQYARAFAEGHPFRFQAGEPISTGATSFAWPAVLALPYALGFHGESILWPAWVLSFAALGALAYEAYRLTEALAGRGAAIGAAAMTLLFGGHIWCAASGMEVVPFAWIVAFATRRASEWFEAPEPEVRAKGAADSPKGREHARTRRGALVLLALAACAPLVRPEGAITSLALGAAVALRPPPKLRVLSLAFVGAALLPNLLFLILTGHATSSTAQVKLLAYSPYLPLGPTTLANVRLLVSEILNGEYWSAEFLPKGCAPFAIMGIVAIGWRGHVAKREFRAILVVLFALTMFVPCAYYTFLWNRLRYLWPFATPWFIGLACLARTFGGLLTWLDARAGAATTALLCGACAGSLATHLDWVVEDAAQSASGIDRQQVALGRWANENLPEDARIGVNDTGAIAYFGNRRTFDVVGLTTPSEGRYWVAGSGSRFEHYERMDRSLLPTHFIVYPEWMDCDPVLGRALHEAIVTDSSILGGQIMRVQLARWDELGTGERPWTPLARIDDSVDVADLESEAEHHYELLGAHEREEAAILGNAPDGALVADGGRTNRVRDRFAARLPPHGVVRMIARVESRAPTVLLVHADGQNVARAAIEAGPWTEVVFDLPDATRAETTTIEVTSEGSPFASFHYFFGAGG